MPGTASALPWSFTRAPMSCASVVNPVLRSSGTFASHQRLADVASVARCWAPLK